MTTEQTGPDSQDVLENLAQAPGSQGKRAGAVVGRTDRSAVWVAEPLPLRFKCLFVPM